jgi:dextranase
MIDIYPEKAQYQRNEKIKLIIDNYSSWTEEYTAELSVTHLQNKIRSYEINISGNRKEVIMEGFDTEYSGFGVKLTVYKQNDLFERYYTAFDVVGDSSMAIRYGFLSDFDSDKGESCKDVENLRKFHINMIQYYDWSYRHDCFVANTECYKDMMGRVVNLSIVKEKIKRCKEYGIKSIGYGAIYASSKEFYNEHKEWGLYTSGKKPYVFIDTFYIMNISRTCPWHEHIIKQYCKSVEEIGFDGIHMDTYGFPKTAYTFDGRIIYMDREIPELIEDAKQAIDSITKDNHLIFNNVGNWPVKTVAHSPQDAIYIEVWDPYNDYNHIKQIIKEAKRESDSQKPIILAAYLKPFREETEERAAMSALLLTAVIVTNGAYHLLLGEENAVLTQGYYVDYSTINENTSAWLRVYYDFLVQYMNLFYDKELVDVSMTHIGWDNTEYSCSGVNWSVSAEAGKVWITIKEKENRKLISLINLTSCKEIYWNQGKEICQELQNIILQVQIDQYPKGIYMCSPDYNHGTAEPISYVIKETDRGLILECVVPRLLIWNNIWFEF